MSFLTDSASSVFPAEGVRNINRLSDFNLISWTMEEGTQEATISLTFNKDLSSSTTPTSVWHEAPVDVDAPQTHRAAVDLSPGKPLRLTVMHIKDQPTGQLGKPVSDRVTTVESRKECTSSLKENMDEGQTEKKPTSDPTPQLIQSKSEQSQVIIIKDDPVTPRPLKVEINEPVSTSTCETKALSCTSANVPSNSSYPSDSVSKKSKRLQEVKNKMGDNSKDNKENVDPNCQRAKMTTPVNSSKKTVCNTAQKDKLSRADANQMGLQKQHEKKNSKSKRRDKTQPKKQADEHNGQPGKSSTSDPSIREPKQKRPKSPKDGWMKGTRRDSSSAGTVGYYLDMAYWNTDSEPKRILKYDCTYSIKDDKYDASFFTIRYSWPGVARVRETLGELVDLDWLQRNAAYMPRYTCRQVTYRFIKRTFSCCNRNEVIPEEMGRILAELLA